MWWATALFLIVISGCATTSVGSFFSARAYIIAAPRYNPQNELTVEIAGTTYSARVGPSLLIGESWTLKSDNGAAISCEFRGGYWGAGTGYCKDEAGGLHDMIWRVSAPIECTAVGHRLVGPSEFEILGGCQRDRPRLEEDARRACRNGYDEIEPMRENPDGSKIWRIRCHAAK